MGERRVGVVGVDADHDRAEPQRGQLRALPLDARAREDGDARAAADAFVPQRAGEAGDAPANAAQLSGVHAPSAARVKNAACAGVAAARAASSAGIVAAPALMPPAGRMRRAGG